MCRYKNEGFIENICWNCGEYNSNSPAFLKFPDLFKNMVRDNPIHYMRKFLRAIPADEILQRKQNDEDLTEPINRRRFEPDVSGCAGFGNVKLKYALRVLLSAFSGGKKLRPL